MKGLNIPNQLMGLFFVLLFFIFMVLTFKPILDATGIVGVGLMVGIFVVLSFIVLKFVK